jgi:hypothetical protein
MTVKVRGVHYDVGHHYAGSGSGTTRPQFEPRGVEADMVTIARELHADAVRIAGTDLSRLAITARFALEAGLTVWYSPFPGEMAGQQIVSYLAEAARMAEELRSSDGSVVMVAGCEMSLFCGGFLPGPTLQDRLGVLTGAVPSAELPRRFSKLPQLLNATLGQSAAAIRHPFPWPRHLRIGTVGAGRLDRVRSRLGRPVPRQLQRGRVPGVAAELPALRQAGGGERVRLLHLPGRR